MPEIVVLQRLLVEAGRGIGDDVRMIGGVTETLVVGIAAWQVSINRMRRPFAVSTASCRICHGTTVAPRKCPPTSSALVAGSDSRARR